MSDKPPDDPLPLRRIGGEQDEPPRPNQKRRRDPFASIDVSKDLRKTSVRGASYMSLSRIAGIGLRFISTGILARMVSQDGFGLITMTAVISGFLTIFTDVGLTQATIQRKEINHRQISTLFWINIALGILLAAIFALSAPWVGGFYGRAELLTIIPVLALSFLFGSLGLQHIALLTRNQRYPLLAGVEIFSSLAGVVVAIVMAKKGMGYWSLVALAIVPPLAKSIAAWLALRWLPGLPSRGNDVKSMVKFGGDVLGFNVMNYFSRQADTMLIAKFCGAVPGTFYEKAYNLLLMPVGQINGPLGAVSIPALSRLQTEPDRFRSYFLNAMQLVCSLSLPVIAAITLFADEVVRVWLGEAWAASATLFRLLAVAALLGGISNPAGWVLVSLGLTKRYRWIGFVNAIIIVSSFVLGLWLGPKEPGHVGSVRGVAIAYSAAMLLTFIPYWAWALKGTPVKLRSVLATIVPPAVSCLPAAAAAWWLKGIAADHTNPWPMIIAAMASFGIVYAVMLLFGFRKFDFFRRIASEFRPR